MKEIIAGNQDIIQKVRKAQEGAVPEKNMSTVRGKGKIIAARSNRNPRQKLPSALSGSEPIK